MVFEFIIAAIATWRISRIIVRESGPFDIFTRLRNMSYDRVKGKPPSGSVGELMTCIWCMSIWVSIVVTALLYVGAAWLLIPFALSGAGLLIASFAGIDHYSGG